MNLEKGGEICERCDGAGTYVIANDILNGAGDVVGHESHTQACRCVRDLPEVEDQASWWETETVWHRVWNNSIYPDSVVEITVDAEVPRRHDGRRCVMRGNRYYPTMIEMDLPERLLMHPFMARELALKLMAAAEVCDGIDEPCSDDDGTWTHREFS